MCTDPKWVIECHDALQGEIFLNFWRVFSSLWYVSSSKPLCFLFVSRQLNYKSDEPSIAKHTHMISCLSSRTSVSFPISLNHINGNSFLLHSLSFLNVELCRNNPFILFLIAAIAWYLTMHHCQLSFPKVFSVWETEDKTVWRQHLLKWAQALLMTLV